MDVELTALELDTLRQMLSGKRCGEIADPQGVTHQAVHVRLLNVRKKAGVRTLVQLGAWAERHGIRELGAS